MRVAIPYLLAQLHEMRLHDRQKKKKKELEKNGNDFKRDDKKAGWPNHM